MKTLKQFPTYDNVVNKTFADEKSTVQELINLAKLSPKQDSKIRKQAFSLVDIIKNSKKSAVESILQEYSLSNEEGVALMCLSEALLRVPDDQTAIDLIEDSILKKNWKSHLGRGKGAFVNTSTWGLMLTGQIMSLNKASNLLGKVSKKISSPIILTAVKKVIKVISKEYILGEDLDTAIKNSEELSKQGYSFSFDMLGESARTMEQAEDFYQQYISAIKTLGDDQNTDFHKKHNLSVKLTALHPKVDLRHHEELEADLYPKLVNLVKLCQQYNVSLNFDAEEAYRLDIYIELIIKLVTDPQFKDFNGIGFVVQAYGLRAYDFLDLIIETARHTSKTIPVRLVKGAYWDTEIKLAQENGHEGYPVFTKKEFTDVSYMACAKKLLNNMDVIYPQFATHNAHTISYVMNIAQTKTGFEFQRLQGMGKSMHDAILTDGYNSRIYAPVGNYEKLLAYLMRRLLENGANTSFVNLVTNESVNIEDLIRNPITKAEESLQIQKNIPQPKDIYFGLRDNSIGYNIGYRKSFDEITNNLNFDKEYIAQSLINGTWCKGSKTSDILSPINNKDLVGVCYHANESSLDNIVDSAADAQKEWSQVDVCERANIMRKFGQLLDKNKYELYSILIREAGKNIDDAIAEVREAIDFAEYYATYAERLMGQNIPLPTYTGESNELSWHSKGVFVCISPWNFPLAIFCGQIIAALVTGNTVIAKPAEKTCAIATYTIKLLLEAGIQKNAVNLVIASGSTISRKVISHNKTSGICFTGSTAVAQTINKTMAARDCAIGTLIAETGGQNAMIVDSSALLEQAVDNIVASAFGSAGQRCSALRVLFIHESIYDELIDLTIGAMNLMHVGDTKDLSYDIGPVISAQSKQDLEKHVEEICKQDGCKLIARHQSYNDKNLKEGTFVVPHIIEISKISDIAQENFGPILHVCKYSDQNIDQVANDINSTGYGLTFGIQSRIQNRITDIASKIHCGNIYANRTMIGAQVGTHPFGGENDSGTGFKAGGPHYLYKFMNERVLTVNTTAIGGNLDLLSAPENEPV